MRKGSNHTRESRRKMSETWRRHYTTGGINAFKGKQHSKEVKEKISKASKAMWQNPEVRRKIIVAARHPQKEETRKKISKTLTGRELSKKHRKHLSEALKGRSLPKDVKEKIGESSRRRWQDPEFIEKVTEARERARPRRPTSIEIKLQEILDRQFPNEWKYVGDGQVWIAGKCPDFINTNGKKALIELFGDYWHTSEDEPERVKHFSKYGFQTFIIWEHELENENQVMERLKYGRNGNY